LYYSTYAVLAHFDPSSVTVLVCIADKVIVKMVRPLDMDFAEWVVILWKLEVRLVADEFC